MNTTLQHEGVLRFHFDNSSRLFIGESEKTGKLTRINYVLASRTLMYTVQIEVQWSGKHASPC